MHQQEQQKQKGLLVRQKLQTLYHEIITNYCKTQVLHLQWSTYLSQLSYLAIVQSCYAQRTKYKKSIMTRLTGSNAISITDLPYLLLENSIELFCVVAAIVVSRYIHRVKRIQEKSIEQDDIQEQQQQRRFPFISTHYTFHCFHVLILGMYSWYYRSTIMTTTVNINRTVFLVPYITVNKRRELPVDEELLLPYIVITFCFITYTAVYVMQYQMKQFLQYLRSFIELQDEVLQKL